MAKPVIWTVDDDPDVLRAVERDLRRQYGDRYRVMAADSGASALADVEQLKLRNEPVALFLVDQRMPRMSGVEFLEKALRLYPDAKHALLTAYADTDAAIRAINQVSIDHYLMKPWHPPEERLYGIVDGLLDGWRALSSGMPSAISSPASICSSANTAVPGGWTVDRDPFYLETSVPGVFVAGDVRHSSAKGVTPQASVKAR